MRVGVFLFSFSCFPLLWMSSSGYFLILDIFLSFLCVRKVYVVVAVKRLGNMRKVFYGYQIERGVGNGLAAGVLHTPGGSPDSEIPTNDVLAT